MNLWEIFGSLLPGLCMAFAIGSRLDGRTPAWLARARFLVTGAVVTAMFLWMYRNIDQRTTMLVIVTLFVCAGAFTVSPSGLAEDNAPPTPAVRKQILAHHISANLYYPPEPRGKRTFDVVAASIGIVLTLPLWFLIAVLIWFEEPGPIFFIKNSVGRGGITFRELKFRSMRYGAERNTGPVVASLDDPRTLVVGRLLRRWHLDELPELLNVLIGTMSVVGPRPLRAVVVRRNLEYVPRFAERHTVRPGIACIAQIEKCHVPPAERLRKDRVYIRRMSLGLDLWLLFRAVVTTVRGEREPAPAVLVAATPAVAAIEHHCGLATLPVPSTITAYHVSIPREQPLPTILAAVDTAESHRTIQDRIPRDVINAAGHPHEVTVSGTSDRQRPVRLRPRHRRGAKP